MIVLWCNLQKLEVLCLRRASLFVFTSSSRRIEWPCRQNIWRFEQFRWNIRAIQEAPVRLWTQNYSFWLKDAKISLIFKCLIFDLPVLWIWGFLPIYLFLPFVTWQTPVFICDLFISLFCLFIALFVCLCVYLFTFFLVFLCSFVNWLIYFSFFSSFFFVHSFDPFFIHFLTFLACFSILQKPPGTS